MGLLDDAIREHLELKRRRGADPSAIAREEREALAAVFPDEADDVAVRASSDEVDQDGGERLADISNIGQETAELDMQAVMEQDADLADGAPSVGPVLHEYVPPAYAGDTPAVDSLEWEIPDERDGSSAVEEVPGQERLSFD